MKKQGMIILYVIAVVSLVFVLINIKLTKETDNYKRKAEQNLKSNQKKVLSKAQQLNNIKDTILSFYDAHYKEFHTYGNKLSIEYSGQEETEYIGINGYGKKIFVFNESDIEEYSGSNDIFNIDAHSFGKLISNNIEFYEDENENTLLTKKLYKNLIKESNLKEFLIQLTSKNLNKVILISPIIKISKTLPFDSGKGGKVPYFKISLLIPLKIINDEEKILFTERNIQTENIVQNKIEVANKIIDKYAGIFSIFQKYKEKKSTSSELFNNFIAINGTANFMLIAEKNKEDKENYKKYYSINRIAKNDNIFGLNTSGIFFYNVNDFGTTTYPLDVSKIATNCSTIILGQNNEYVGNKYIEEPTDKVIFDCRSMLRATHGIEKLESCYEIDENYGCKKEENAFWIQDYDLDEIYNSMKNLKNGYNSSVHFCSLNGKCYFHIDYDIKTNSIKGLDSKYLGEFFIDNFDDLKLVRKTKKNLFYSPFENPFNFYSTTLFETDPTLSELDEKLKNMYSQRTDLFLDITSSFNFGAINSYERYRTIVLSIGLKIGNELIKYCDECKSFPFIYRKYYIITD